MIHISVSGFRHADIRFEVLFLKKGFYVLLVVLLVLATAGLTFVGTSHWMMGQFADEMDSDAVKFKMELIKDLLDTYFIDEYDVETLNAAAADGAAAAMVTATGDKWSYYISASDMEAYDEQMNNAYVGIGVTILEAEDGVAIVSVTPGSPAEEAGILPGDVCIAVEGQETADLGLDGTKNLVRGEEGTFVNMRFRRGAEILDLQVERRTVITPVAEWEMLEDNIAWITIFNFDAHCAEQTLNCMEEALDQGAQALLFDVRFNGGGYKDEMVLILDELLPEGDIFRSVDYQGKEDLDTSDADCLEIPMAVLVNEDSYSAAEFFAAALQEYGVAEVVGVQTSGKGNFQYTLDLGDGSAVSLSCGKYYTPNGVSLTDVGVTPDVVVDLSFEDYEALYYRSLEAAEDEQLQAAIENLRQRLR